MTRRRARLVLLPGLGCDARLFEPQRRAFPALETPAWLEPERRETLAAYGARMARALSDDDRPLVLGGVSFGGMVALEMARHLELKAVVLLASAAAPSEVRLALRAFKPIVRALPLAVFRAMHPFAPFVYGNFAESAKEHRELFVTMLRDTPPSFLRWACGAALHRRVVRDLPCPVLRIHGSGDRIVPAEGVSTDLLVRGGGHLLNLTHPEVVNAFLREALGSAELLPNDELQA